jgi:hypothetical protein
LQGVELRNELAQLVGNHIFAKVLTTEIVKTQTTMGKTYNSFSHSTDYADEQRNEKEALQSIYPDAYSGLSTFR